MDQPLKNLSVNAYGKLQAAQQETTGDLGDFEKEIVNYIFFKIAKTWGEQLYALHVGDESTLRDTKRDWARNFLEALNCKRWNGERVDDYQYRARAKVDQIFSELRMLSSDAKTNWEFPSLKKVCSYMGAYRTHAAHREFRSDRALVDLTSNENARKAGEAELNKMKNMLKGIV